MRWLSLLMQLFKTPKRKTTSIQNTTTTVNKTTKPTFEGKHLYLIDYGQEIVSPYTKYNRN